MSGAGPTISSDGAVDCDRRDRLIDSLAGRLESRHEARWIVDHVARLHCESPQARAGSGPVAVAVGDLEERATALALRREGGEPLQYVLGRWSFRGLELLVDPRVLVPRPETEQVVEVALAEVDQRHPCPTTPPGRRQGRGREPTSPVCVDLGTGSGAIALSLVAESKTGEGSAKGGAEVWATDLSADALAVAACNRTAVLPSRARPRIHLRMGSWYRALPASLAGGVDLVVSNPPYVAAADVGRLEAVVKDHEPHLALAAADGSNGVAGFAAIEQVVSGAAHWLRPTGVLVVELDPAQAGAAVGVALSSGFRRARIEADLAGRERMLVAGAPS